MAFDLAVRTSLVHTILGVPAAVIVVPVELLMDKSIVTKDGNRKLKKRVESIPSSDSWDKMDDGFLLINENTNDVRWVSSV